VTEPRRCRWCGRPIAVAAKTGRPREFCRRSCRQRDYEARQRSVDAGLSDGELIVTRQHLDALRDRIWILEAAIEDVERDLAGDPDPSEYADALQWVLEAAKPVVDQAGDLSSP
jgi:hypothetical protein